MARHTGAVGAFAKPRAKNKEGHPTFKRTLEERTLQVLMTGTLQNTFYATRREVGEHALVHFEEMAKKSPSLFAKMLVYAREKGFMRSAPVAGLVVLSKYDTKLFAKIFNRIVRTPRNLKEFILLIRKGNLRGGLGRAVKNAINKWIQGVSEYQAIKYGGSGDGMSWRDIFRLTRPKPGDERQDNLFKYMFGGKEVDFDKLPQIAALEQLKRAEGDGEAMACIREGRLPWELASTVYSPEDAKAYWEEIGMQMPYMALLRNLNSLNRHGCLKGKKFRDAVIAKLTNEEAVRRSMQLPFRFNSAFEHFEGPQAVRDAIGEALEVSVGNIPDIDGQVAVAVDISGSMGGKPATIAGIFAAAIAKRCENALILRFDTQIELMKYMKSEPIMTLANRISGARGGTNIGLPAQYLSKRGMSVDTLIILTDNEHWAGGWRSDPDKVWKDYRKKINKEALAFHIALQPYGDYVAPASDESVHLIQGWSDDVLRYVSWCGSDKDQIDTVKAIEI